MEKVHKKKDIGKIILKIINIVFWIFFGFFLFINISLYFTNEKTGVPRIFNYTIIKIATGSMEDAGFEPGTHALIRICDTGELKSGDYIAFYYYSTPGASTPSEVAAGKQPIDVKNLKGQMIVFHEIIDFMESDGHRWFITKGASNDSNDPFMIYDEYVIGKYHKTSQVMTDIINILMNPLGRLIIVIIPVALIITIDIYKLILIMTDLKQAKNKKMKRVYVKDENVDILILDGEEAIISAESADPPPPPQEQ